MNKKRITTSFRYYDEGLYAWENTPRVEKALTQIASVIGEVIIAANSLEDALDWYTKELMSTSESGDELIYIFLSEMNYIRKVNTLIRIYGWHLSLLSTSTKRDRLKTRLEKLDQVLRDAGETRNRYAHANWETLTKDRFVKVRTKATSDGVKHTFRQFKKSVMKDDLKLIQNAYKMLEKFDDSLYRALNL